MIEKNNDNYAIKKIEENKLLQEKLIIEKEYFDNMFNKIDSNIIIDEDQRKTSKKYKKFTRNFLLWYM